MREAVSEITEVTYAYSPARHNFLSFVRSDMCLDNFI